jgi:hypothetical protein
MIGVWFLALELYPNLKDLIYDQGVWPVSIVGIGVGLAVIGILTWSPGMFVPACIVGGIGGLLWWQNSTGNWESWAYAWALIPGFVGVGTILTGIFTAKWDTIKGGAWTLFVSLMLFAFFGSFLGGWTLVSQFWPVLLILFGVLLLVQGLFRRR